VTPAPGEPYRHCCLGVACRVAEANGLKIRWVVDNSDSEHGGRVLEAVTKGVSGRYNNDSQTMPGPVWKMLRFHSSQGDFPTIRPAIQSDESGKATANCLTELNDTGWTFDRIADFVEAHPEEVFSEPV
jgi:hypothetical protein